MRFEILVEGLSDVPVMREIMQRRFRLDEDTHFRIHPHQGKGRLPSNSMSSPNPKHRGLLDQLPAKLRGYTNSLTSSDVVLVLIDADATPEEHLHCELNRMLAGLQDKPSTVIFQIAVEEMESWFLADCVALKAAFGNKINTGKIKTITPDAIVGAWEQLAKALNQDPRKIGPGAKTEWAKNIAPHLNLDSPSSPSLSGLIHGVARLLDTVQ